MSELVSMHMDPLGVPCPKCKTAAGKRCRTLTTGRSTDTHEARWLAWFSRACAEQDASTEQDTEG